MDKKEPGSKITDLMVKKFHIEVISIVILIMWLSKFIKDKNSFIPLLVLIGVFIMLIIEIKFMQYILKLKDVETANRLMETELTKTKDMVDSLRTQKHEFANILQVISGLAQLKKFDHLMRYINTVKMNLNFKSACYKLNGSPELNVIVNSKFNTAKEKGIETCLQIDANFSKLNISTFKLITIISNLLDNAIRALDESGLEDKKLKFSITREERCIVFGVWDNFGPIPDSILRNMFSKGFTTKQEEGHGIGLFTVRNLAEELGGIIDVDTSDNGTLFSVSFIEPKQSDNIENIEEEVKPEGLSMESENVY